MLTGMELIRPQKGLMSRISSELGITRAAVNKWKEIPPDRVLAVAKITGFAPRRLRPDGKWPRPPRAAVQKTNPDDITW